MTMPAETRRWRRANANATYTMPITASDDNLPYLQEQITQVAYLRKSLQKKLRLAKIKSFLFFWARRAFNEDVRTLEMQISQANLKILFGKEASFKTKWKACLSSYAEVLKSEKIWQLSRPRLLDQFKERSLAEISYERSLVEKKTNKIEFVQGSLKPIVLPRVFGPTLEIYPTFLLVREGSKKLKVYDLKKVEVLMEITECLEEENIPKDTQSRSYTWKRANKDGSQDKRFQGNYPIPKVDYGILGVRTGGGVEVKLVFSNWKAFSSFESSFRKYLKDYKG